MELKCCIAVCIFGLCSGYTVPNHGGTNLEESFGPSLSDRDASAELSREGRGLLFKKHKKHSASDTVYVNRRYEGVDYRPNREIYHHHHYSQQPSQVYPVQTYPAPSQDYHHFGASEYQHGYGSISHGSSYPSGSYSSGSSYPSGSYSTGSSYPSGSYSIGSSYNYPPVNYGHGGYAHYGGVGGYASPSSHGPISAAPLANGHNKVDRGQGAAAVNNIAIIHARNGAHSSDLSESESRILPRPLPIDFDDHLNTMD